MTVAQSARTLLLAGVDQALPLIPAVDRIAFLESLLDALEQRLDVIEGRDDGTDAHDPLDDGGDD